MKSKDSTDGNVYIITGTKEKYVLKVYTDINHVVSMCKLHALLVEKGFNVPKIIRTKNNQDSILLTPKKIGILYSFLEGTSIDAIWDIAKDNLIREIAKSIRRLHDETKNNNSFQLAEVPFEVPTELTRKSVLHFDLTKSNIFYNKTIGFIDFDDSKYGASVIDVSIACAFLFISKKNGLDQKKMSIFLEEYYKNNKSEKEKELKFLKDVSLSWIQYLMNNHQFDSSLTESFSEKEKWMKHL